MIFNYFCWNIQLLRNLFQILSLEWFWKKTYCQVSVVEVLKYKDGFDNFLVIFLMRYWYFQILLIDLKMLNAQCSKKKKKKKKIHWELHTFYNQCLKSRHLSKGILYPSSTFIWEKWFYYISDEKNLVLIYHTVKLTHSYT